MSFERIGPDLHIAWPAAHSGFTLKFSDAWPASVWTEADVPVVVVGDQNVATVPVGSNTRFFRLEQ